MAATEPLWAKAEVATVQGEKTGSGDPWLLAAKHGPADSGIDRASRACFEAADAALCRAGAPPAIRRQVTDFAETYVVRGRCPADEMLEESR
jgi:glutamate--cysteine ligase